MAINSYGYPPTIAPGSVFSRMSRAFGGVYSTQGFNDFRVTAAGSGTRRANVAAGWAMGKGVLVENTATATIDLPAPSGSSQWFLIGLKRWTDNPDYPGTSDEPYLSELVYVAGTSSRAVPSVTQDAGVDDTQWLALCRVNDSSTLIQEVVDLRLVSGEGGAGYTVFSAEALAQIADMVGVRVYRADSTGGNFPGVYDRVSTPSGTLYWLREGEWQNYVPTFNTGNVEIREARYRRIGNDITVRIRVLMKSMGTGDQIFTCTVPVPGRPMTGWADALGVAGARRVVHSGAHMFNGFVVSHGSGNLDDVTVVAPSTEPNPVAWGIRNNQGWPINWGADGGAEVGMTFSYEAL